MICGNIEDYQLNRTHLLFPQYIIRNRFCSDYSNPDCVNQDVVVNQSITMAFFYAGINDGIYYNFL
jgi:hypothetical protein